MFVISLNLFHLRCPPDLEKSFTVFFETIMTFRPVAYIIVTMSVISEPMNNIFHISLLLSIVVNNMDIFNHIMMLLFSRRITSLSLEYHI